MESTTKGVSRSDTAGLCTQILRTVYVRDNIKYLKTFGNPVVHCATEGGPADVVSGTGYQKGTLDRPGRKCPTGFLSPWSWGSSLPVVHSLRPYVAPLFTLLLLQPPHS